MTPPEPVFSEPWHAQVFAVTVRLNETGHLPWPEWAAAFSRTLKRHGLSKELDGGDDYFLAWLETLEKVLVSKGMAETSDITAIKAAWETAYLRTPHGKPVHLAD
ncbi:nitrile hydratase accessory protein [Roseobacter denitrificans]|nr:nitrile hydratase accessory protein [Roseobacter denitrificans]AVL54519.1 nitrile hydratase accessory protein [Roseobacter denitrificans]SFF90432.1 nitrile hydratase accessory protein [Roseobacter denitrificans OCh 114]